MEKLQEPISKLQVKYDKERHNIELAHESRLASLQRDRAEIVAKIPHFWYLVLYANPDTHPYVADELTQEAMKHCTSIEMSVPQEGYKITMVSSSRTCPTQLLFSSRRNSLQIHFSRIQH